MPVWMDTSALPRELAVKLIRVNAVIYERNASAHKMGLMNLQIDRIGIRIYQYIYISMQHDLHEFTQPR